MTPDAGQRHCCPAQSPSELRINTARVFAPLLRSALCKRAHGGRGFRQVCRLDQMRGAQSTSHRIASPALVHGAGEDSQCALVDAEAQLDNSRLLVLRLAALRLADGRVVEVESRPQVGWHVLRWCRANGEARFPARPKMAVFSVGRKNAATSTARVSQSTSASPFEAGPSRHADVLIRAVEVAAHRLRGDPQLLPACDARSLRAEGDGMATSRARCSRARCLAYRHRRHCYDVGWLVRSGGDVYFR